MRGHKKNVFTENKAGSGRFIDRKPLPHRCTLPTTGETAKVGDGTIWECNCGKQYTLTRYMGISEWRPSIKVTPEPVSETTRW